MGGRQKLLTYPKEPPARPCPSLSHTHSTQVYRPMTHAPAATAPKSCAHHRCSATPSTGGAPHLHLPSVMPATTSGTHGSSRPPPRASAPRRCPSSSVPPGGLLLQFPSGVCPPPRPDHRRHAHAHTNGLSSAPMPAPSLIGSSTPPVRTRPNALPPHALSSNLRKVDKFDV
jgi:hypothetical protein